MIIKPQKGKQEQFLSSKADIVFYGGAAGGGKTYAALIEPLRHINNKNFLVSYLDEHLLKLPLLVVYGIQLLRCIQH